MDEEPKAAIRQRTFLKGTLYYDSRRASVDCVIRDMSDTGARLTFDNPVTVPDHVELFIPHKQQTLRARVQRRGLNEIGVAFEVERTLDPRRTADAELQQRVESLETEITALKRLVAKLKAKVLPHDLDAA
ncbi:MAG: PilZ domain-containing protein [Hyphomicrobiales bacterium]